jgi:N-alpha-acetyltransferase 38, NatC auxiliary subunit
MLFDGIANQAKPNSAAFTSSLTMSSVMSALHVLKSLLRKTLRVTIDDGRIFLGTFAGTDKDLNVILVSTSEFRSGEGENPDGRFVGQVMIPWRFVVTTEVQGRCPASGLSSSQGSSLSYT